MKTEIIAILSNDIMYKVGNTNQHLEFIYKQPFPKVVQIERVNELTVKVELSNEAFVYLPVNNLIIFCKPNIKEIK